MNKKKEAILNAIHTAEREGSYSLKNGFVLEAELFPCEDGTHSFEYNYAIIDDYDDSIIFSCWENRKESLKQQLQFYV